MARTAIIIPTRYESKRFPGKALAKIGDRPLIQHVYQQARKVRGVEDVLVATDDERIRRAVEGFGGRAVMTAPGHRCGTERVAEATLRILQGHGHICLIAPNLDLERILEEWRPSG